MARNYHNLGSGEDVLEVVRDANADMSQVEIADFTVLGRVDGARSIDEIVAASGVPEAQALESLRKFLRLGMVRRRGAGAAPVASPVASGSRPLSAPPRHATPTSRGLGEPHNTRPAPAPVTGARHATGELSIDEVLSQAEALSQDGGVRRSRTRLPVREKDEGPRKIKGAINAETPQGWPIAFEQFMFDPQELEQAIDLDLEKRKQVIYFHYHLKRVTYYDLFQVPQDVDSRGLRKAYFKLSKDFHPDSFFRKELGGYQKKIEEVFRWLSKAYEVLSDEKKREAYDLYVAQGLLGSWDERQPTPVQVAAQQQQQQARNNLVSQQVEALKKRAEQAERLGQWEQAARFYSAALSHGRSGAHLASDAGRCLIAAGKPEEAERVCAQALAWLVKPAERVETLLVLAQLMDRQERWVEAARWYREVCQAQPSHAVARSQLARAERMMSSTST
jgi:hypothetical protein